MLVCTLALRFPSIRYSKPIPHCCLALQAKSTFVYLHFQVLFALENLYLVSFRPHKRVQIQYNRAGPPNERLKSSVGTTSHARILCDPVVKSEENLYTSFYSSSVAIQIKEVCCFDVLFFPINISIFVNEIWDFFSIWTWHKRNASHIVKYFFGEGRLLNILFSTT